MDQVDLPALTKGLSLCTGALVIICSIVFMAANGSYLSVVVGIETMVFAAFLLVIEVQQPAQFLESFKEFCPGMLTIQGQLFVSVLTALFLFAMDGFGIAMAIILVACVCLNAYTLNQFPDSMPARFGTLEPSDMHGDQYAQPPFAQYAQDAPGGYEYNPSAGPVGSPSHQQQQQQQTPSTADL